MYETTICNHRRAPRAAGHRRRRAVAILLALTTAGALCTPIAAAAGSGQILTDPEGREFFADEVIVKLRPGADVAGTARRAGPLGADGADVAERLKRWGVVRTEAVFPARDRAAGAAALGSDAPAAGEAIRVELPAGSDVLAAQADIAASPDVEWAEPAYVFRLQLIPNDPQFGQQWGLHNPGGGAGQLQLADADVDAPAAWDVTQGSASTVIAIIDTGVDLDHPDLDSKIWQNPVEVPGDKFSDGRPGAAGFDDDGDGLIDEDSANRQPGDPGYSNDLVNDDDENGYADDFRGWNFLINVNDPQDDQGHGTHCAGIAAAETNNGIGIAGACPNCEIMPLKAFTSSGIGDNVAIARAIDYAATNGASVISMSFGSTAESLLVKEALEEAYATATLVAAAGNNGNALLVLPMYPAEFSFVIGVGASNVLAGQEVRASFSNPLSADVYAPGVNIRSTVLNDSYTSWSGTSMAAPLVAGIAGLLRSHLNGVPWEVDLWFGQLVSVTDLVGPASEPIARSNAAGVVATSAQPALALLDTEVQDPLGNADGIADAGETVDLRFTIENRWGAATGITATIASTSPYVTILDANAAFGNLGPRATGQNNVDKITIQISPSAPNNAELLLELVATAANGGTGIDEPFTIPVRRGQTIGGGIGTNTTLAADTEYIVTGNMVVASGVTLTIEEGARVRMSPNALITVHGTLIADGAGGDPIVFTANQPGTEWAGILITFDSPGTTFGAGHTYASGNLLRNVIFEKANGYQVIGGGSGGVSCIGCPALHAAKPLLIEDSEFRDNLVNNGYGVIGSYGGSVLRRVTVHRNVTSIGSALIDGHEGLAIGDNIRIEDSIITDNVAYQWTINSDKVARSLIAFNRSEEGMSSASQRGAALTFNDGPAYADNCFLENENDDGSIVHLFARGGAGTIAMGGNFWDATTIPLAKAKILDFEDGFSGPTIDVSPILTSSSALCPAHLASVGVAPGSVLGAGLATFTLTFNRAMDTGIEPSVTFGVAEPYTQRVVDGSWTSATTWVGTYNVSVFTGEGIQTLRVAGARGALGTEVPIDRRTSFTISTTGLNGVDLQASGEAGRVDLTFNPVDEPDLAGFNVYRADASGGAFVKLNTAVVLDTLYSDFTAPEGVTKYYKVRAVRTDLSESDFSAEASAAALDGTGPSLSHTPITQVSDAAPGLTVQANASDPSGMGLVRLHYKRTGEPSFVTANMVNPSGTLYSANIPGSFITLLGVDYYIEANDAVGNQSFSGSAATPHHVLVYECQTAGDCADDGSACSVTTCASGLCTHPAGNAGTTCRAAAGDCDVAETCDGASSACPPDAIAPAGTSCRAAAGGCDVAETCSGSSSSCPANALVPAGTVCRAAAGACDVAETCSGSSATCPGDGFVAIGTTCRAATGVCDAAESCTGSSGACPADTFAAAGTVCRPASGACDPAEQCTGSSGVCPADVTAQDSDGDLVCDAQDACTNPGDDQDFKVSPKPKAILSKINSDITAGNDKLVLQGVFSLATGQSFAAFDPVVTGARVLLLNQAGGSELDVTLPGGTYGGIGTRGWKTNGARNRWQYLDRTFDGSAATFGGIVQFQAIDRSRRAPREVMVKVQGKNGTYPVVAADSPIQAVVVLGGSAQSLAGLCGESDFATADCAFNASGNTLKCSK